MLLREQGFTCDEGIIYFAGSKERVRVIFDSDLETLTLQTLEQVKSFLLPEASIPPPLEESKKCLRCSLLEICLPDELNFLNDRGEVRQIIPSRHDAIPLHIIEPGARVRKNGNVLEVWKDETRLAEARIEEISQVALLGPIDISTPTVHELLRRGIPLSYHGSSGWFLGCTVGLWHKNAELRTEQYRMSFDARRSLDLAKTLVKAKIANSRTLLRRNARDDPELGSVLDALTRYRDMAGSAETVERLLGIEGVAAAAYFEHFSAMFTEDVRQNLGFDFRGRHRRPPPDPVNVMLSFGYAMLTREWTTALMAVGLDPFRGFYHQQRPGRPALALDMMEPFRPLLVDSVVITAANNGELKEREFIRTPFGCSFTPSRKKAFISCFERRMEQEITHPIFGYKISYRRLFEVQARLLGRFILGEIKDYPAIMTR
jgi:CRISPR-associated endonuclease Cas1